MNKAAQHQRTRRHLFPITTVDIIDLVDLFLLLAPPPTIPPPPHRPLPIPAHDIANPIERNPSPLPVLVHDLAPVIALGGSDLRGAPPPGAAGEDDDAVAHREAMQG